MPTFQELLQQSLGPQFVVEREAGSGGMATVYVVRDTSLDRRVAVKVLSRSIAGAITLRRFALETRTLAGLQHPNIVPVLWTGEIDGLPYFVMPFVDGETLRDRLGRGPLTVRETGHIARDVARALSHAHARGVVHRDIKPENILITHDAAIVSDFGIAKAIDDAHLPEGAQTTSLTGAGLSLGTPRYMAPEQVAADPHIDHRADLYSLGIVLYEMLVGSPPFSAASRHAILTAHLTEVPKPLVSLRPEVPGQLAAAIDKCLAKKPSDRFASADELLRAIENASGSIELPRTTRPAAPRARLLASALGIGVVLIGVTMYVASRGTEPRGIPSTLPGLSIAILPIANANRSEEQVYLAEGVTAELSDDLTRVPGVRVVSSTSVAYARNRHATLRELGAALNVGYFVENELVATRERVRLASRMIDAARDSTMWSRSYEGAVVQLDSLQSTLSRDLSMQLASYAGINPTETTRATEPRRDPEAYDNYLRATHLIRQRRPESLRAALALLESSTGRDPSFARAHAAIARVYSLLPLYAGESIDSVRAPAIAAVERALALDPRNADAYTSRAALLAADWRRVDAERDFTRAISFDSSNVLAWQWRGEMYLLQGRVRDAVHDLQRAAALDPYSGIVNGSLAVALSQAGEKDAALEKAQLAAGLDSVQVVPLIFLGAVQIERNELEDANTTFARVTQRDSSPLSLGLAGYVAARRGDRMRAQILLRRLEQDSATAGALVAAARILIAAGDNTRALTLLHAAADRHDPMFATESLGSAMYDPLRGSSRFRALMRKIGLDSLAHSR